MALLRLNIVNANGDVSTNIDHISRLATVVASCFITLKLNVHALVRRRAFCYLGFNATSRLGYILSMCLSRGIVRYDPCGFDARQKP